MHKKINYFLAILLLLITRVCYAAQPFIIDTDVGSDDVLAIVYLLKNPDVQVKAILVDGDATTYPKPGVAHVLSLLDLTNYPPIPVAAGPEQALGEGHSMPAFVRQFYTTIHDLPPSNRMASSLSAPDLLIKTLNESHEPVTILNIGSLTNLAIALKRNPAIKNKIKRVYMMGGAVDVPGNIRDLIKSSDNASAEWNFYFDPVAAKIVFDSGLPITLIPLDATNQYPLTQKFINDFKKHDHNKITHFIYLVLIKTYQQYHSIWYFWDPLAAIVASNPEMATTQKERLTVLLHPPSKVGALQRDRSAKVITVVKKVNGDFRKQFIETIAR